MKPAAIEQLEPPRPRTDRGVDITWHEEIDPRRQRRVAEILADILDNASTPDKSRQP